MKNYWVRNLGSRLNTEKRLLSARTIMRDVEDIVDEVLASEGMSREEMLNKFNILKEITAFYEDDYSYKYKKNLIDSNYVDRKFPTESRAYAETLVERIREDYRKYMACNDWNKRYNNKPNERFKYYGMSKSVYVDIKKDIGWLRYITQDSKDLKLYLENVCFNGMPTVQFVNSVLGKKSAGLATFLKGKLIDKIVQVYEEERSALGTMVKENAISEHTKKIVKIEQTIDSYAFDKAGGDTRRYYEIVGELWEKYEDGRLTEQDLIRGYIDRKRKIGRAPMCIDSDGVKTEIDTKINDISDIRDDYVDLTEGELNMILNEY